MNKNNLIKSLKLQNETIHTTQNINECVFDPNFLFCD